MYIRNCTDADIAEALRVTNDVFFNNVHIKRLGVKGNAWIVTLCVEKTRAKNGMPAAGVRTSVSIGTPGRLVHAACWHVHGVFLWSLPSKAEYKSTLTGDKWRLCHDEWLDKVIGPPIQPILASKACYCDSEEYLEENISHFRNCTANAFLSEGAHARA